MKTGARMSCRRSVVDVHRTPEASSEVVTQARLGDTARIIELVSRAPWSRSPWVRVRFGHDGYEGWVDDSGFASGVWPDGRQPVFRVRNLFANIHAAPSVRTPRLITAPLGAPLVQGTPRLPAVADGWLAVEAPGNIRGYAQIGDLVHDDLAWPWRVEGDLRAGVVREALNLIGLPYRWGGTTPYGFDCSGLVQCLYRLHGIMLPRDVTLQVRDPRLSPVDRAAVISSDLLVFGDGSHIGMAISGKAFVHATTHRSPVVQISAIDDPHWAGIRDGCYRVRAERSSPSVLP